MSIRNFLFGGPGTATSLGDVGLLIVRITLGLLIALGHGWGKVFHGGTPGPSREFVRGVAELGFPAPELFAWMAGLSEFFGGLLVAAGLLTRPAALALSFTMAVAAFGRHINDPWVGPPPSKELALLFLAPFFLLLLIGGGRYAVDSLFRKQRRPLPKRSDQ